MRYECLAIVFLSSLLISVSFAAIEPRIVGGEVVKDRSEFPYQALLRHNSQPYCAATIISEIHVLSAAHCFFSKGKQIKTSELEVVVGQLKLDSTPVVKKIQVVHIHENYSPYAFGWDIAVVKIKGSFGNWTDDIASIALTTTDTPENVACNVSGWGSIHSGGYMSDDLNYVGLSVYSWDLCKIIYGNDLDSQMICAYALNKDSCQGDSGGPLVCNGTLTGIVSFGADCAITAGVYTQVSKYLEWIKTAQNNSESYILSWCLLLICANLHNIFY